MEISNGYMDHVFASYELFIHLCCFTCTGTAIFLAFSKHPNHHFLGHLYSCVRLNKMSNVLIFCLLQQYVISRASIEPSTFCIEGNRSINCAKMVSLLDQLADGVFKSVMVPEWPVY